MSAQIIPFAEARARLRSTAPPAWAVYLAGLIFWPLACWLSLAELLKWGMGG